MESGGRVMNLPLSIWQLVTPLKTFALREREMSVLQDTARWTNLNYLSVISLHRHSLRVYTLSAWPAAV